MKFVELSHKHKDKLKELFIQLTKRPTSNVDIAAMLDDKKNFYAVLEKNDTLIGFGVLIMYHIPSTGKVGRIEDVIVDEKYRGQGFGKLLVQKMISVARENGLVKLNLTSNSQRIAAQKLYETLGFQKRDTDVFVLQLD